MKLQHFLSFLSVATVCLGTGFAEEIKCHEKARIIVGISNGSSCGPVIPIDEWKPLNDKDREYCGSLDTYAGNFSRKADGTRVNSEETLFRIVQWMASSLEPRRKIMLDGPGVKEVQQWLRFINTSIFGTATVVEDEKELFLDITYSSAARILAAFQTPAYVKKLTEREKQTLQLCVDWICENIPTKMPFGLKVKKVHDAIIDCAIRSDSRHDAMDVLLDGEGSSAAYASATQLLLSMLRIDCRVVQGRMKKEHSWNLLKMGKEWYHLDTCCDDPSRDSHCRMYDYCMLTDAEMASDHKWNNEVVYPKSPKRAKLRFYLRNELRRGWQKTEAVYAKGEEESKSQVAEQKALQSDPVGRLSRQLKSAKLKSVETLPKIQDVEKKKDAKQPCATAEDINKELEARLDALDDSKLKIKCAKKTPAWRMRQMVAESALPSFAEEYCVSYDDRDSTIIIEPIKFWTHRRLLAAVKNKELLVKLSHEERKALEQCHQWVALYGTVWKQDRQKVRDVHMALVEYFDCDLKDLSSMDGAIKTKSSGSLGYAQTMYVVCSLMDIPCRMVHGRTEDEYQIWNMVRLGKDKWYHLDAAQDDYLKCLSAPLCQNLLLTNEEMKKTHAWDESEFPDAARNRKKKNR